MTEYNVISNGDSVSICKGTLNAICGFIDIYVDDPDTPSPFEDVETATLFAEIIVKLLKVVDKSDFE